MHGTVSWTPTREYKYPSLPMYCAWNDCGEISWRVPLVPDGHGGLTIASENARPMYCGACRRLGRIGGGSLIQMKQMKECPGPLTTESLEQPSPYPAAETVDSAGTAPAVEPLSEEDIDLMSKVPAAGFHNSRIVATIRALQAERDTAQENWRAMEVWGGEQLEYAKQSRERVEKVQAQLAALREELASIEGDFPHLRQANGQIVDWGWIRQFRQQLLSQPTPADGKVLVDKEEWEKLKQTDLRILYGFEAGQQDADARLRARIKKLEEVLRVVKFKAGSHTVSTNVKATEDDPGFSGIYLVADKALAKKEPTDE